jgi:hypothetical protein
VLRIDTSLLLRPDYLGTYPALAAFLEQHPEVVHNPAYFIGDAAGEYQDNDRPPDARMEAVRGWRSFVDMVPVVAIIFIITSTLAGLIRTLIDQRRWQRAARMQMDMHTKLIDRFSGSDELLAYTQSPLGRGLVDFQVQPITSSSGPRMMNPPLGRIFWSVQWGIVLAAAGLGLLLVGARVNMDELSLPLSGMGVLALAVGVGFVLSAGISYVISQRLGLLVISHTSDLNRPTPNA